MVTDLVNGNDGCCKHLPAPLVIAYLEREGLEDVYFKSMGQ